MELREIYSNIYQIDLGAVNCYLINEPHGLTLIDAGYARDKPDIIKAIRRLGKQPANIQQVILTHLHPDHAGGAAGLQQEFEGPVYAHAADATLIAEGICGRLSVQVTPGFINWCLHKAIVLLGPRSITPVGQIRLINDSEVLPILAGLEVIHTPGHSAGHVSLLAEHEQLLFAGDVLVNFGGLKPAPVYEDPAAGKASVKKLAARSFDLACFGHGKPITNANQRFSQIYSS
ncbi:MBL fold metallo-hydrolase [Hymenobacter terrenus]|uniref:MBL fold metallo-hydrolase n=1 Tax=Hymenobacter terrenus TaxID=1629124 RepID=UPI00061940AB|nr:MBL fold metallo-hydrolase [Hymenobacter terrenus]